ncbi:MULTISPECIES: hypothetical protein [unclassified Aureispira]|uniref:hypothetical protein n=1 Tax=unclassified Aureispira TaxID=2649989 RepID=UPI000695FAAE|nr:MULTISPECIES: hypothetical protein [unclassified Aureispira]WMX14218.1 hypothetical protein QP953_25505 [Aureispira sp. CCB-E]
MKRLKLDDFKLKSLNRENEKNAQKLLGQVLGDCHDEGSILVPIILPDGTFIGADDLSTGGSNELSSNAQ